MLEVTIRSKPMLEGGGASQRKPGGVTWSTSAKYKHMARTGIIGTWSTSAKYTLMARTGINGTWSTSAKYKHMARTGINGTWPTSAKYELMPRTGILSMSCMSKGSCTWPA